VKLSMAIAPAARIEPSALIGEGVTVGPYCVIGANVVVEDGGAALSPMRISPVIHGSRLTA